MDGSEQQRLREQLSAKSRKLLDSIDELHALERQKRDEDISTPRFHQLADTIVRKARAVFRTTAIEETLGDAIDTGNVSINDVASDDGGGETTRDEDPGATRHVSSTAQD